MNICFELKAHGYQLIMSKETYFLYISVELSPLLIYDILTKTTYRTRYMWSTNTNNDR